MKQIIKKSIDYKETFRTAKVAGMFDLPPTEKITREWEVDLPIEEKNWKIGLIVGSSGSGKTTIAKNLFKKNYCEKYNWDNKSIVDNFDKSTDISEIIDLLCHVGFSSPPNWLLPYHSLSNGQQFRVDLARSLANKQDLIVIDEFTSVVDRTVAKTSCVAVNKTINKLKDKKLIAVSCHEDIAEWLQPDWIFNVDSNSFKWVCLRRPEIKLQIYKCDTKSKKDIWKIFKHHHYLSGNLMLGAIVFVAMIDNNFCGFTSARCAPVSTGIFIYQEHRTVVLPDFQGIGIGNKLSEFLGNFIWNKYKRLLRSTTSHPAMIFHRNKSPKWEMIKSPKINSSIHAKKTMAKSSSYNRITASFKFNPKG